MAPPCPPPAPPPLPAPPTSPQLDVNGGDADADDDDDGDDDVDEEDDDDEADDDERGSGEAPLFLVVVMTRQDIEAYFYHVIKSNNIIMNIQSRRVVLFTVPVSGYSFFVLFCCCFFLPKP